MTNNDWRRHRLVNDAVIQTLLRRTGRRAGNMTYQGDVEDALQRLRSSIARDQQDPGAPLTSAGRDAFRARLSVAGTSRLLQASSDDTGGSVYRARFLGAIIAMTVALLTLLAGVLRAPEASPTAALSPQQ